MRKITVVWGLLLLIAGPIFSQEYPEWTYVLGDGVIEVFGEERASISLSVSGAGLLHPTPGGKYVYVSFDKIDTVLIVDVEDHSEAGQFTLGFVPGQILFSQMGETAYIGTKDTDEIRIYTHKSGSFEYVRSIYAGTPGSNYAVNRRGTRLYRPGGRGVEFVYVKTGAIIEDINIRSGVDGLFITPDYREIWAISGDGDLVVVDEGRAKVRKRVEIGAAPGRAFFERTVAYFLAADGGEVLEISRRNLRSESIVSFSSDAYNFVVDSEGVASALVSEWMEVADLKSEIELTRFEISGNAHDIARVVVKSGEGFACF